MKEVHLHFVYPKRQLVSEKRESRQNTRRYREWESRQNPLGSRELEEGLLRDLEFKANRWNARKGLITCPCVWWWWWWWWVGDHVISDSDYHRRNCCQTTKVMPVGMDWERMLITGFSESVWTGCSVSLGYYIEKYNKIIFIVILAVQ